MLLTVQAPDIHLLKVFVTIADCGSFAKAQVELNVAQSTISTQMADLEKRLGMRLCNRGRSGFSVTDDGLAVYEAARRLFNSLDEFTTRVNYRRKGLFGTLRIGMADGLYANPEARLPDAMRHFRAAAEAVKLELLTLDPLGIEQGLMDGQLHVGLHFFPHHAPGLSYFHAFTEEQSLYCGRGHPLFEIPDEAIDEDDLSGYDYTSTTYLGDTRRAESFPTPHRSATVNMLDGMMTAVMSGQYISYLPTHWAAPYVAAKVLRPILPDRIRYGMAFEMAVRTDEREDRRIASFMEAFWAAREGVPH